MAPLKVKMEPMPLFSRPLIEYLVDTSIDFKLFINKLRKCFSNENFLIVIFLATIVHLRICIQENYITFSFNNFPYTVADKKK